LLLTGCYSFTQGWPIRQGLSVMLGRGGGSSGSFTTHDIIG